MQLGTSFKIPPTLYHTKRPFVWLFVFQIKPFYKFIAQKCMRRSIDSRLFKMNFIGRSFASCSKRIDFQVRMMKSKFPLRFKPFFGISLNLLHVKISNEFQFMWSIDDGCCFNILPLRMHNCAVNFLAFGKIFTKSKVCIWFECALYLVIFVPTKRFSVAFLIAIWTGCCSAHWNANNYLFDSVHLKLHIPLGDVISITIRSHHQIFARNLPMQICIDNDINVPHKNPIVSMHNGALVCSLLATTLHIFL